jgi:hypothetical protein
MCPNRGAVHHGDARRIRAGDKRREYLLPEATLARKHPVKAAVLLFCWLLGRRDVAIGSV